MYKTVHYFTEGFMQGVFMLYSFKSGLLNRSILCRFIHNQPVNIENSLFSAASKPKNLPFSVCETLSFLKAHPGKNDKLFITLLSAVQKITVSVTFSSFR